MCVCVYLCVCVCVYKSVLLTTICTDGNFVMGIHKCEVSQFMLAHHKLRIRTRSNAIDVCHVRGTNL